MSPGTRRRLLALGVAGLALAACGKKGPPVPPEVRLPVMPAAIRGAIDDGSIVVTWTAPGTRIDGSRLRRIALYHVYRREEEDTGSPKAAMLSSGRIVGYDEVATIRSDSPAPATVQGSSVTWVDHRGLGPGRRYVYVVTAVDEIGRSSAPSERLVVPFLSAPKAPRDLTAAPGDRRVTLAWQPPEGLQDGSAPTADIRYVVLRGPTTGGALAAVTPQPLDATTFTDTGVENDVDYRYAVRAVRVASSLSASGGTSAEVTVAATDTTPPAAPTGLVAVPSGGAIRLAWNASPEPDVAVYGVYRATESGDFVRIATTVPPGTVYEDRDVRSGTTYRYAVSAIDRARRPNESARSSAVSARAQ